MPHGEHIVYMGDSLERFEWLALALSLKRGWELGGELPSPLVSSEWPKWSDFFRGTTAMLAPHVRCDCFRRDDVRNRTHPLWMRQLLENRYFWIPGVLNLTLIGAYNLNAVQGGWVPGDPDANRAGPHAAFAARWRYNWSETIRRVVAKLEPPPTALVMNAGHWGRFRESELAEIVAVLEDSRQHQPIIDALNRAFESLRTEDRRQRELGVRQFADLLQQAGQQCPSVDRLTHSLRDKLIQELVF